MTSGTASVIGLPHSFGQDSKIKGLKQAQDTSQSQTAENIVWKDLGQYLETLTDVKYGESQFKNELDVKTPLNSSIDYRVCTLCNRPILTHHLSTHIERCLQIQEAKQGKQGKEATRATDLESKSPAQISSQAASSMVEEPKTKKRKADKEATPATDGKHKAKKPKKESTAKTKKKANQKNKGPVDVERQCGVALPGGGFCARSLTCKTHSMGAKRAVPGRSASYDVLLAAYQHKNQVKIAGQAAKLQEEKDEMLHAASATLDPDEETHQVLAGVQRSFPLPLERKTLISTRIRTGFLRMREMFAGAILPRMTHSNGVGGFNGRTALLDIDRPNEYINPVRAPQRLMMSQKTPQGPNGHANVTASGGASMHAQTGQSPQQQQQQQQGMNSAHQSQQSSPQHTPVQSQAQLNAHQQFVGRQQMSSPQAIGSSPGNIGSTASSTPGMSPSMGNGSQLSQQAANRNAILAHQQAVARQKFLQQQAQIQAQMQQQQQQQQFK